MINHKDTKMERVTAKYAKYANQIEGATRVNSRKLG
jgi:hypothetical protein